MARLAIHLLGSFQVSIEATPITNFESNKVRALLAYLAVESGRSQRREKLADLLWPEMSPQRANSNLNQALYNLRRLIQDHEVRPPYLLREREWVQFNADSDFWLDVHTFETLTAESGFPYRSGGACPADTCERLQAAVDLYRGDFLEGLVFDSSLAFDEWVLLVRQRLQRQVLGALHWLADHHTEKGETAQALLYAWRQVELDPLGEPACRQLMRLLAASDQRSQALAQFERLQTLLAEELSVAPEAETLALSDRIRDEGRHPTRITSARENLPAFLTPLIGRREELAELKDRIEEPNCRLLTILGPGGSGKTRLALEIAHQSRVRFHHGAFFVPLDTLQSADSILPALAETFGLLQAEGENRLTQLTSFLQEKDLLLVLDGFEHLSDAAPMLAELLHQAPGLKLLVTSRASLKLMGEYLYPLGGMRYPQKSTPAADVLGADAVQLLLSGLERARPGYKPDPADAEALLQICRQVQGMPLGLLLAASWGTVLGLDEIAIQIRRGLDFLAADWTDVPTRQRSMRATFDHTWSLLGEREQGIFPCLAVFQGGFTRRAAREVCGAIPNELRALVERSLLWNSSPGWYEMHALLRQYGREKLASSPEAEQEAYSRHSSYYLDRLAQRVDELKEAQQADALAGIDLEHENTRAAWNWAAGQGAAHRISPVVDALCLYYDLRQRFADGESACRAALEGLDQSLTDDAMLLLQAHLLIWQSRFTRLLGRHEQAHQQQEMCKALLGQVDLSAVDARFAQALLSIELGDSTRRRDFVTAREYYLRSVELFRELDKSWWAVRASLNKIECDLKIGDYPAAQSWLGLLLSDLPAQGDRRSLAEALRWKAFSHARQGETVLALHSMQEATAVYRSIGDLVNLADSLSGMGMMMGWQGRFQEAVDLLVQSLQIYRELGDNYNIAYIPAVTGMMMAFLGHYSEAEEWVSKALPLGQKYGFRRTSAASQGVIGMAAMVTGDFPRAREAFQGSIYDYRQVNHLDELGWALAVLAQADFALDETEAGLAHLRESLQIGIKIRGAMTIVFALCTCALWVGRQGDPARAVELYSLASRNPGMAKSRWFADVYGEHVKAFAGQLAEGTRAAAQERGRKLDLWQTATGLLEEFSLKDSERAAMDMLST